jgi:hypothetical protein
MKSILIYKRIFPAIIIVILLLTIIVFPVSANPGLKVDNALVLTDVSPGQVLIQKMTVSIASDDPATDITVSMAGVAQNPQGGFQLLDASQDTGPYSAREWVTVDISSFHLEPGVPQDLVATIQVPDDVSGGGHYAIINIATKPVATGGVGIITAVNVPVYLTIKDSQLIHTGTINNVSTGNITSGQPVAILTDFLNTGNHHFKIQGEVTISNASGEIMGTTAVSLTAGSLIPGMTRRLEAAFIPQGELAPGNYNISSKVMLEDGTVLDEASGSFEVEQAYTPPPGTVAALSATPAASNVPATSSTQSPGAAAGINSTTLVVGVAAGAIIIFLLVLLLRRRG